MLFRKKKAEPEKKKEPFIRGLEIAAHPKSYTIPFFPDVEIPNTKENYERWHYFVGTLSAKLRIGTDPEGTGDVGILYRNGEWLGDLVLADDVKSFNIIEDITHVHGDLVARMARKKNKYFTHEITVDGDLIVHKDILKETPPVLIVKGGMHILGVRTILDFAVSPFVLEQWGFDTGKTLQVAKGTYTMVKEEDEDLHATAYILKPLGPGSSYFWDITQWTLIQKAEIGPETTHLIFEKLTRICKFVGVGQDFIIVNKRKLGWDIRKLCLYLTLVQNEISSEFDAAEKAKFEVIGKLITSLRDLERNIYADNPDEPNLRIVLDSIDDAQLDAVKEALSGMSGKADDEALKRDIAYCNGLLESGLSINEIMRSTPRTALFLHRVLESKEAKAAALEPLQAAQDVFKVLVTGLGLEKRIRFAHLLKQTEYTMDYLRVRAAKAERGPLIDALEAKLAEINEMEPRELLRAAFSSSHLASGEAPKDKRLLSDMFSFQGDINFFPILGAQTLELLLVNFDSFITRPLEQVRRMVKSGEEDPDKGIQIITGNLLSKSTAEFVEYVRERMEWDLSVFKSFNAQYVATARAKEIDKAVRPELEAEFVAGPPPEILNDILFRLNRLCLIVGLGKNFLEQHSESYDKNIEKLRYFLHLCMKNRDPNTQSAIAGKILSTFDKTLEAIVAHMKAGGYDTVETLLQALTDVFSRKLQQVLSLPRGKEPTLALKNDMQLLEGLQRSDLDLDDILPTTERALFYLNGILESREARKALSTMAKPLRKALAILDKSGANTDGVTINDLLRDFEGTMRRLEEANPGDAGQRLLRELHRGLDNLRETSTGEIVAALAGANFPEDDEAAQRDKAFLTRLARFDNTTLGFLALNASRICRLLLMFLESELTEDMRDLYECGTFSEKSAIGVISTLYARLEWRLGIIQAHNTHAR